MTEDEEIEALLDQAHATGCQTGWDMVIAWAEKQIKARDGQGGYAKGQRYILRQLIEDIKRYRL